jgi:hypothetical protein
VVGKLKRTAGRQTAEQTKRRTVIIETRRTVPRLGGAPSHLAACGKPPYTSRRSRALRLAVQDAALSRRKHGFDSRRARQTFQWLSWSLHREKNTVPKFCLTDGGLMAVVEAASGLRGYKSDP